MAEGKVILATMGILTAWLLSWGILGFTLDPWWWLSLAVPGAWALGIAFRKRGWLTLGFCLAIGLAAGLTLIAPLTGALAVVALALWSWDLGLLWISRLQRGEPEATHRLARAALLRATALCAAGFLAGVGFTWVRVSIPFWGLVGGAVALWAGGILIVRALRTYGSGHEASGNRSSSSGPTG
ncbi:MAG TPA: hypothetical protein PLC08_01555 [Candidatus Bipolaricaulis sp.]|nr:hypothetical protein [Candidatus Bipolaricaulis sp.]HPD06550.1 hypothetical protein [Candidatus Bipolaricaulis sp.]HRS13646.1 hypothetical protein [Candidatus Bipolaricaulis sp.]HRU21646.1 hypothetical protein [Candidatus Bipolaricaulis sp.]